MPRAVVFDLDYTLAVPSRDRATILSEAVEAVGGPDLTREEYLDAHRRNLTGETREPIFADLLATRESDADPAALASAYREAITASLETLPGVEDMLDRLRETHRVGLLTNGPVRAQRAKLSALGLEPYFDATVVTGELEAGKPDPRAFEAVATELGVDPADAVYVGDEVAADVAGATAAGMDAIQVVWPDGPETDPRAVATVHQSAVADELPRVVARLE